MSSFSEKNVYGGEMPDGSSLWATFGSPDVTLRDQVSVIDPTTGNIDVIEVSDSRLEDIVITPDGTKVYVKDNDNNTIVVIDPITKTVSAVIPIDGVLTVMGGIVTSPDSTRVYVAVDIINSLPITHVITVIDTATAMVIDTILVSEGFFEFFITGDLAITPDGETLYGVNTFGAEVGVIEIATKEVGPIIPVGFFPTHMAIPQEHPICPAENSICPTETRG